MINLKLHSFHEFLSFREENGERMIFDPVRKNYYKVQPEELVRQTWIQFLAIEYRINTSSLGVEKQFKGKLQNRRFDLVLYRKGEAFTLFEFKSFNQPLNQQTALQAASYNLELQVPYTIISNGLEHYAFHTDFVNKKCTAQQHLDFLEI